MLLDRLILEISLTGIQLNESRIWVKPSGTDNTATQGKAQNLFIHQASVKMWPPTAAAVQFSSPVALPAPHMTQGDFLSGLCCLLRFVEGSPLAVWQFLLTKGPAPRHGGCKRKRLFMGQDARTVHLTLFERAQWPPALCPNCFLQSQFSGVVQVLSR